ncbi:hypothetical protein [Okeania sp.]|uniref:hypothetical protein n=1 Tax=Okeania sp. TaxID=3100323 RepID=UPI002B4B3CD0|nr:hypothetical protein [Okeania sp.]MEB3342148.1 hypothetical protein [Okeania sp.]
MMHTIPHIVRMSNFNFIEKVLCMDTAPLSGDKVMRPGIGTLSELRDCCDQLISEGIVDKVVEIKYDETYQKEMYQKHFGSRIKPTHNYKGYPILGSIFHLESVPGDYVLHYDSDMLLHQQPDYSWVDEGMKLMEKYPEIMAIRPLTGPPTEDGSIYQRHEYLKSDAGEFYQFKFFSSRVYLINRKRFDKLLPLPILWRSYKNKFLNQLPLNLKTPLNYYTNKGKLDSWEVMVSMQLERTDYVRATMSSPKAWTIHPKDRSPEYIRSLPNIIEKIEQGWYPPEQAGHYDFISEYWL